MFLTCEPPPAYSACPSPERLPSYSLTVFRSGPLNRKIEFSEPGIRPTQRAWTTIYATVQGTIFKVYKLRFSRNDPYRYRIRSVRQYTLQYAESGIAFDYKKRPYVLRVRVEGEQFLLQCRSPSDRNAWLEAFQAAADISLDLDLRESQKDPLQTTVRVRGDSTTRGFIPTNSYMVHGRASDLRWGPPAGGTVGFPKLLYRLGDEMELSDGGPVSHWVSSEKVREAPPSMERENVSLPALGFNQERKFSLVIIKGKEVFIDPSTGSLSNARHASEKESAWTKWLTSILDCLRHLHEPIIV